MQINESEDDGDGVDVAVQPHPASLLQEPLAHPRAARAHACTHARSSTRARAHTRTHTHTHARARARTYAHTTKKGKRKRQDQHPKKPVH
jgi:hypothetical protein